MMSSVILNFFSAHAAEARHVIHHNIVVNGSRPRFGCFKVVVEFGSNLLKLRKSRSGDVQEVVVFVVVADVEGKPVQRAVIGVGFLTGGEDVVLRDEMTSDRVDGSSKERRHAPVVERSHAEVHKDKIVESELGQPVAHQVLGWRELFHTHRSEGIESDLHHHPDCLANFAGKKSCFGPDWHVRVNSISPLVRVVIKMVFSKSSTVRQDDRQVAKIAQQLVLEFTFSRQIV